MQLGGHNSVHGPIHHTTEGENPTRDRTTASLHQIRSRELHQIDRFLQYFCSTQIYLLPRRGIHRTIHHRILHCFSIKGSPKSSPPKSSKETSHISDPESPTKEGTQENLTSPDFIAKETAQSSVSSFPKITSSSSSLPPTMFKYVDDLNLDITEIELYEFFDSIGGVASIFRVSRDLLTKPSLAYAYNDPDMDLILALHQGLFLLKDMIN